jgi:hypothetical protein
MQVVGVDIAEIEISQGNWLNSKESREVRWTRLATRGTEFFTVRTAMRNENQISKMQVIPIRSACICSLLQKLASRTVK